MKKIYTGGWILLMIVGELLNNIKNPVKVQNKEYQIFFGTWQFTEVVSQHGRLGGDEGYEDLIGKYVTYRQDLFENEEKSIVNPEYSVIIIPIRNNSYNPFFTEQIGLEKLLPEADYAVFIQIIHKPSGQGTYYGNEFLIKDNNTMYSYDNNCIYKLTRINYLDNYDEKSTFSYQERW